MESKEDKKKTRGRNFEFAEKDLLIDCAGKNRTIIEAKLTNSVTVSRKRAVWEGIGAQINALGFAQRSVPEIKTKWSNIVQKAKKEKSEIDNYRKGTGGSPPPKPLSPSTEKVLELFAGSPAFIGLKGIETTYHPDESTVKLVASDSECVSPTSSRFIEAALASKPVQLTPDGDAPPSMDMPEGASSQVLSVEQDPAPSPSPRRQLSSSSQRNPQSLIQSKKRKVSSLDVQAAQLEVLQHQKEKLILQVETIKVEKEKLLAEKLHYDLLNKRLLKDISLEN